MLSIGNRRFRLLRITVEVLAFCGLFIVSRQFAHAQYWPASSCQGIDACTLATGPIGENSCNGVRACYMVTTTTIGNNSCNGNNACRSGWLSVRSGTIGNNSCNGMEACAEEVHVRSSIGDNSCNSYLACTDATGPIGNGSCNNGGCYLLYGSAGNNSCNGIEACEQAAGPIGDSSCNSYQACLGSYRVIGNSSCNGYQACTLAHKVGDRSCNGDQICYRARDPIGSCMYNTVQPPDCIPEPPNLEPVCSNAYPSIRNLWPPNHQMVDISILGVTDPEGDPITIDWVGVAQDEPINDTGDGDMAPDANISTPNVLSIRAERAGTGDGRVYHIVFVAEDDHLGYCNGIVEVDVPLNQTLWPHDDGCRYDSAYGGPSPLACLPLP